MAGPLHGIRIVEMAGLGPGPFAAMMLADHGADVIRVERAGMIAIPNDPLLRSRRSISLDLKQPAGCEAVRRIMQRSDGLIEGYRPGVMERLGLGPRELIEANPKLVYGRVTGWGQHGPLAQEAGHDINYVAISGLLHGIGPRERPVVPVNYLADYAGGGMMLAFAMLSALLHVQRGGEGQVVDAAMTDGAALVGALTYGLRAAGLWDDERESNLLDGGDPAYHIYCCADGKFLAVGAVEPEFRRAFLDGLGLSEDASRGDIEAAIATRSRDVWARHFAGKEACVSPVLDLAEAPAHPHNAARQTFIDLDGVTQPAPAPRYSMTSNDLPTPPRNAGEAILTELGYSAVEVEQMREQGALL
jgi:alpha-methylacyl-CoA racemase